MADILKQAGKSLHRTGRDADYSINRIKPKLPIIERSNDVLSAKDDIDFWMEFKSNPYNSVTMDLTFRSALPNANITNWLNNFTYNYYYDTIYRTFDDALVPTEFATLSADLSALSYSNAKILIINIDIGTAYYNEDLELGNGYGDPLYCEYSLELLINGNPYQTIWYPSSPPTAYGRIIPADYFETIGEPWGFPYHSAYILNPQDNFDISGINTADIKVTNVTSGGKFIISGRMEFFMSVIYNFVYGN